MKVSFTESPLCYGRKNVGLVRRLSTAVILLCGTNASFLSAQNTAIDLPAAAVAPVQEQVSLPSVDESLRFGVSSKELYAKIDSSLVEVLWGGVNSAIQTSGFSVLDEGIYASVIPYGIKKESDLTLRRGGATRKAKVLVLDERTGLCLIKSESGLGEAFTPLELRAVESRIDSGDLVFALNRSTTDEEGVCVVGRLAGRDSVYHGLELPTSYYRINMHLLHPGIGGPVVDETGKLIGILTARQLKEAAEYHALPAAILTKLFQDQQQSGRSSRVWIGASFHLQSTTPQVIKVREGSPAAQCGLLPGDVILKVDNRQVSDINDLVDVFYVVSIGQELRLQVLRGIEKLNMKLIPSERPNARASQKVQ